MAHYPERFLEELSERADMLDVVGQYVRLKKQGVNWLGLCPFHNEKTPSFTVRPDQGFFKCFGCGAGGNLFNFIMQIKGVGFPEAVAELAATVGVALPTMEVEDAGQQQRRLERRQLLEVVDKAREWFYQRLRAPEGEKARAYLQRRALQPATIERFGLGYAPPGWRNLLDFFGGGEAAAQLLEKVGLLVPATDKLGYDRFRDRIIFPIRNAQGECIAFGGRVMAAEEPKYINSPETALYQKSEILYGLHLAQAAMQREERVLVVEGYLDLIALADRGVESVVATLGTALTTSHVRQLWKRTRRICFCFDGDTAGRKAAWRALEMVLDGLQADQHVHFLLLPQGEDPDDLVRREGAEGLRSRLDSATPLLTFMLQQLGEGLDRASPEGRVAIRHRAWPLLSRVRDPLLRELYLQQLSQYLDLPHLVNASEEVVYTPSPAVVTGRQQRSWPSQRITPSVTVGRDFERALLAIVLRSPELVPLWEEELSRLDMEDGDLTELLSALLELGSDLLHGSATPIWQRFSNANLAARAEAILLSEELQPESLQEEFQGCLRNCQLRQLNRQIKQITQAIEAGEGDMDRQFGVLLALKEEKRHLQQRKSHPLLT
ncbi:DNA primase [Candidatus Magnetaquicoccus inordinatus]|uniref:DNA primase n=1 Tax=Candidatus Magnetaquicoccus inordinatus TaxID=2496818 RepID=UPI00102CF5CD|nr:DNA primase [Candidatus Magnetaquicoccus inordinatus]